MLGEEADDLMMYTNDDPYHLLNNYDNNGDDLSMQRMLSSPTLDFPPRSTGTSMRDTEDESDETEEDEDEALNHKAWNVLNVLSGLDIDPKLCCVLCISACFQEAEINSRVATCFIRQSGNNVLHAIHQMMLRGSEQALLWLALHHNSVRDMDMRHKICDACVTRDWDVSLSIVLDLLLEECTDAGYPDMYARMKEYVSSLLVNAVAWSKPRSIQTINARMEAWEDEDEIAIRVMDQVKRTTVVRTKHVVEGWLQNLNALEENVIDTLSAVAKTMFDSFQQSFDAVQPEKAFATMLKGATKKPAELLPSASKLVRIASLVFNTMRRTPYKTDTVRDLCILERKMGDDVVPAILLVLHNMTKYQLSQISAPIEEALDGDRSGVMGVLLKYKKASASSYTQFEADLFNRAVQRGKVNITRLLVKNSVRDATEKIVRRERSRRATAAESEQQHGKNKRLRLEQRSGYSLMFRKQAEEYDRLERVREMERAAREQREDAETAARASKKTLSKLNRTIESVAKMNGHEKLLRMLQQESGYNIDIFSFDAKDADHDSNSGSGGDDDVLTADHIDGATSFSNVSRSYTERGLTYVDYAVRKNYVGVISLMCEIRPERQFLNVGHVYDALKLGHRDMVCLLMSTVPGATEHAETDKLFLCACQSDRACVDLIVEMLNHHDIDKNTIKKVLNELEHQEEKEKCTYRADAVVSARRMLLKELLIVHLPFDDPVRLESMNI